MVRDRERDVAFAAVKAHRIETTLHGQNKTYRIYVVEKENCNHMEGKHANVLT